MTWRKHTSWYKDVGIYTIRIFKYPGNGGVYDWTVVGPLSNCDNSTKDGGSEPTLALARKAAHKACKEK